MPSAAERGLRVRRIRRPDEVADALALRHRVFCEEQGVPVAREFDGLDSEALHLAAVDGDALLGTCRLLIEGDVARVGRLAVERDARGRGIGRRLLQMAEREARGLGARSVELAAHSDALSLYERSGYERAGEPFADGEATCTPMRKALGGS